MASIAEVYQTNQAVSASPLLRLLTVYDYALSACKHRRHEELSRALRVLNEGLNFDYPVALRLASIYQWCADLAREGDFEAAAHWLKELRDAWAVAGKMIDAPSPLPVRQREPAEGVHAVV